MDSNEAIPTTKAVDIRTYKAADRIAYMGLGVYSFINVAWIVWALTAAGFAIFDTATFIGIVVPIIGLLSLIMFQCCSRQNRFSILANVLSIFVMFGWFLFVWYLVAAASAAV